MLCKVRVCVEYHNMPRIIRRNDYQNVLEFHKCRFLPIKSVDYRPMILLVALIEVNPISQEYGIKELLRVIPNNAGSQHPPMIIPRELTICEVSPAKPYNYVKEH